MATRTELLAAREELALAIAGRDLLREKREHLLDELRRIADEVVEEADELSRSVAAARAALALAEAIDGPQRVRSAALAAVGELPLVVRAVNVMGVEVAEITHPPVGRPLTRRGYALAAADPRIDVAAASFERVVEVLLHVAAVEARLQRLATEVGRVTRRMNALDVVVIPAMQRRVVRIQAVLDERERQEHFRLKRIKAKLERRR